MKNMNSRYQHQTLIALVIGCLMILTAFATFNASGSYTSPGSGQTCTLNWLAGQTSAVQKGAGSNYTLTDDVTISGTDTFQMNNGEHLWINNAKKLTINGNMDINGQQNSKAYIAMSTGQRSDSINVDWNYNSAHPNTIDIDYLDITNIKLEFTDQNSVTMQFYAWYPTEDTNPIIITPMVGAFIPGNSHGYAIDSNNAFKDITTIIFRFNVDSDGDGVPNWWEAQNGFDPGTVNNWNNDADSDGLTDGTEYLSHSNPRVQDTDGDTINDGPEVITYYSNPLKQYTDSDGFRDDEEVTNGVDGYITDPCLPDTDGDGIDDDDEYTSNPVTDPTDPDTDNDGLYDGRDKDPTHFNRRFAFIFEVNYFDSDIADRNADIFVVPNALDDEGWDVYLFTDYDYNNDGYSENNIDPVYAYYISCTWANFQTAWTDFKAVGGPNNPIGTEPANYGDDIVLIYIDTHGRAVGGNYQMAFADQTNQYVTEGSLEDILNDLAGLVDFIWINTPNAQGWKSDIATGDDLSADDRFVVTSNGDVQDNDVFYAFIEHYYDNLNGGCEGAWQALVTADENENLEATDMFPESNPNLKNCFLF